MEFIWNFGFEFWYFKNWSLVFICYLYFVIFGINDASAAVSNLGLVGYWSMNEGAGSYAGDSSGNKNTGTLTNGPTWVDGKKGKALNFDGSDDYVDSVDGASLNLQNVSMSGWVKTTTSGGYIVAKKRPQTVVYLTTTDTSPWTLPADWPGTADSVEVIGAGGSGTGGGGGGGGAYSKKLNLAVSTNPAFQVGVGGTTDVSGTDTWFKSTGDVLAKGGTRGRTSAETDTSPGGAAASGVGDTKYSGGTGAAGGAGARRAASGGGGAAGPAVTAGGNAAGATARAAPAASA